MITTTTTTVAELRAIAGEAYGAGCVSGDPFYAGVEALALHLAGGNGGKRLRQLLDDVQLSQRVQTDPRRLQS